MVSRTTGGGSLEILEQGDIYLGFRPQPGVDEVATIGDVERFYIVLAPQTGEHRIAFRILAMGGMDSRRQRRGRPRYWGLVTRIADTADQVAQELGPAEHTTSSRARILRPAARPCGEGAYCIARHHHHTHLAYLIDSPRIPTPIRHAGKLGDHACYTLCIKNPARFADTAPNPQQHDPPRPEAAYPPHLQARLGDRRLSPADPPDFLDFEGAHLILTGGAMHPSPEHGAAAGPLGSDRIAARLIQLLKESHEPPPRPHPFESAVI